MRYFMYPGFKSQTKPCPVCRKHYLTTGQAMALHIIGQGRAEADTVMQDLLTQLKKKGSMEVTEKELLKSMPHVRFHRKNLRNKRYFRWG